MKNLTHGKEAYPGTETNIQLGVSPYGTWRVNISIFYDIRRGVHLLRNSIDDIGEMEGEKIPWLGLYKKMN